MFAQVSTLVFSYQFNIFAARPSLDALLFEPSASGGGDDGAKFVLEGWALVLFSAVLALVVPDLVRLIPPLCTHTRTHTTHVRPWPRRLAAGWLSAERRRLCRIWRWR